MSTNGSFRLDFNDSTLGMTMAAILLFTAVIWAAHSPNVEKADFSLIYVGATLVHKGLGSRLYDVNLQKQTRDALFRQPSPLFFEHPPFEALLLSPLACYSYRKAYLLWGLVNATIWLLTMIVLRRYLHWPREDLGYIGLWFLFAPLGVALYQGQSSIILLAVYAAFFLQLRRGNDLAAGALLALGLVKLQFVAPLLLIFFLLRQWRVVAGFSVTAVGLCLLSVATVGAQGAITYGKFLLTVGSNPQNVSFGSGMDMPTIHGLTFAVARDWLSPSVVNILAALFSLLLVAWVGWRWRLVSSRAGSDLMFASAISTSLVAGSHMFTHDFSPLLLGMFIVASQLRNLGKSITGRILISTLVVFWTFPIYFLFVAWHCLFVMCPVLLLFTAAAATGATFATRKSTDQLEHTITG